MGTAIHYCRVTGKRIPAEDFLKGKAVEWNGYTYSSGHIPSDALEAQRRGMRLLPADLADPAADGSALSRRLTDSGKLALVRPAGGGGAGGTSARGTARSPQRARTSGTHPRPPRQPDARITPTTATRRTSARAQQPAAHRGKARFTLLLLAVVLGLGGVAAGVMAVFTVPPAADDLDPAATAGTEPATGGEPAPENSANRLLAAWLTAIKREQAATPYVVHAPPANRHTAADQAFDRVLALQQQAARLVDQGAELPAEATATLAALWETYGELAVPPLLEGLWQAARDNLHELDFAAAERLLRGAANGERPAVLPAKYLDLPVVRRRLGEMLAEAASLADRFGEAGAAEREGVRTLLRVQGEAVALAAADTAEWDVLEPLRQRLTAVYDERFTQPDHREEPVAALYAEVAQALAHVTQRRLRADLATAEHWPDPVADSYLWTQRAEQMARLLPPWTEARGEMQRLAQQARLPLYEAARETAERLRQSKIGYLRGRDRLAEVMALVTERAPLLFGEALVHVEAYAEFHSARALLAVELAKWIHDAASVVDASNSQAARQLHEVADWLCEQMLDADAGVHELRATRDRLAGLLPEPAQPGSAVRGLGPVGQNAERALARASLGTYLAAYANLSMFVRLARVGREAAQRATELRSRLASAMLTQLREQRAGLRSAPGDPEHDDMPETEDSVANETARHNWRALAEVVYALLVGYGGAEAQMGVLDGWFRDDGPAEPASLARMGALYTQWRGTAEYGHRITLELWWVRYRTACLAGEQAEAADTPMGRLCREAFEDCVKTMDAFAEAMRTRQRAEVLAEWAQRLHDAIPDWLDRAVTDRETLQRARDRFREQGPRLPVGVSTFDH